MDMRKRRHAGMADEPDLLTPIDPLAALDHDTALSQMAVLGLPAIRMANNDPVTAEEISFGALKLQLLFFLLAVMKQVQAVLKVPSMAPQLIGIVRRLPILLHLYMPDLFFCNLLANHIHAVAQQCRN